MLPYIGQISEDAESTTKQRKEATVRRERDSGKEIEEETPRGCGREGESSWLFSFFLGSFNICACFKSFIFLWSPAFHIFLITQHLRAPLWSTSGCTHAWYLSGVHNLQRAKGSSFFFRIYLFIYLRIWRKGVQKDRERQNFIHWFIPSKAIMTGSGSGQIQEPGASSGWLVWVARAQ